MTADNQHPPPFRDFMPDQWCEELGSLVDAGEPVSDKRHLYTNSLSEVDHPAAPGQTCN